jgi:hypothetical protein
MRRSMVRLRKGYTGWASQGSFDAPRSVLTTRGEGVNLIETTETGDGKGSKERPLINHCFLERHAALHNTPVEPPATVSMFETS